MEIEKQIRGYEGLYSVRQDGTVKSLARTRSMGRSRIAKVKERILKQHDSGESMQVNLSKNGKSSTKTVHSLVFDAFIGEERSGLVICHNDGDYKNNNLENLRLDTQQGNIDDRRKHGNEVWGEKHRWTKLTADQARYALSMKGIKTQRELADELDVHIATIGKIHCGKNWKCLNESS